MIAERAARVFDALELSDMARQVRAKEAALTPVLHECRWQALEALAKDNGDAGHAPAVVIRLQTTDPWLGEQYLDGEERYLAHPRSPLVNTHVTCTLSDVRYLISVLNDIEADLRSQEVMEGEAQTPADG